MYTLVKSWITHEDSTYTRQVMHYARALHVHSSSHALRTRTPRTLVKSCTTNEDSTYTLVKSCITNEDSTYTRQVMHYERGLHVHSSSHALRTKPSTCIHSSSHALRTRIPHALVQSCITNEDSTYTRQVMHYERRLHMYTLVKSWITREDSTYTRQVMHYARGLHILSSSHTLRTRYTCGVFVRNA